MGIEYAIIDEYDLPGWNQSGLIDGTKYAVWTRVINGHRCSIAIGKETKKYYAQIDGDWYGLWPSPESAANEIVKRIMRGEVSLNSLKISELYREKYYPEKEWEWLPYL